MTLNDLGTIMELQLPIRIALMNDERQQMVHVWQVGSCIRESCW